MSYIQIDDVGQNTLDRVKKILFSVGQEKKATHAIFNASQRAASKAKTEAGRFAAAEYTIGKSGFMSHCKVKTSVGGTSSVAITFAGQVIPLIEFKTQWTRGGGIATTVKAGSTMQLRHAFLAAVYGKTQAHEHEYGTTGPVKTLYGPSTGHMMQNDKVIEQMDKTITETFERRIDHEISRILAGIGT